MFVADDTPPMSKGGWHLFRRKVPATFADVYSAAEVAAAAGVRLRDVRRLVNSGVIVPLDRRYFSTTEAVRGVRWLKGGWPAERVLFRAVERAQRQAGFPVLTSAAVHALMLVILIATARIGAERPQARVRQTDSTEARLVFLVAPGPGGGGGGGGHREEPPPIPAERKGPDALRSPLAIKRPPPTIDPPPVVRELTRLPVRLQPPIVAPVIPLAADARDRVGLPVALKDLPAIPESRGPGAGNGVGSAPDAGVGDGSGPGIGPGTGGGTGGGPYRPGSGVTAPSILREVKPDYTDEARRRNLEGNVDLEIIVRDDGMVGSVKVLQGLGSGLDERAINAVRQWRFSPATRSGAPVDVVVEVSVEFRLR